MKQILSLFVVSLTFCTACSSFKSNRPERDVTVIVAGDLHFDLPPETDQYYHVVTMNRLPGNFSFPADATPGIAGETVQNVDGVIIAGDMFDKQSRDPLPLPQTV